MIRGTIPFGRIDLEGTCQGVPISLHTDYGLGVKSAPETWHELKFQLNWDSKSVSISTHSLPLFVGTFTITDEVISPDEIEVSLWDVSLEHKASRGSITITDCAGVGMTGSFNLSFPDGSTLSGSFNLTFGSSSGQTSVQGTWQGEPVSGTTFSAYSRLKLQTISPFTLMYCDDAFQMDLWFSVCGDLHPGDFAMPMQAWVTLHVFGDTGPEVGVLADLPGTLSIIEYSKDYIRGSYTANFSGGDTITGTFSVSLVNPRGPQSPQRL